MSIALICLIACGSPSSSRQHSAADGDAAAAAASPNWPSFRGPHASGVSNGQNLPDRWDGDSGLNIAWKTRKMNRYDRPWIGFNRGTFLTTAL